VNSGEEKNMLDVRINSQRESCVKYWYLCTI